MYKLRPFLCVAFVAACSGPDLHPHLAVEMEGELFQRGADGRAVAPFTIRNVGSQPAYFLGCPAAIMASVERFTVHGWTEQLQANTICLAIHTPVRLELAPGADHRTNFSWGLAGVYRLRVVFGTLENPFSDSAYGQPFEFR